MASLLVGLLVAAPALVAAGPPPAARFTTDRKYYSPGTIVRIVLSNTGSQDIKLTSRWTIHRRGEARSLAEMIWGNSLRTVEPGERRVWEYPQDFNTCGKPQNACTDVGGHIGPGRYYVRAETSLGVLKASFQVGRYFTLGFRCSDSGDCEHAEPFVVFVNEERPIRQMKREARAEEKTLIVSGIVRGERFYNPAYSYTMGPSTIVLGEMWTEVCDAHPNYVESHRRAWMGERWCPWSSYVAKIGR